MAFLAPHAPRQPVFRAPAVVLVLIGGLVAAHVARTLLPPLRSDELINQFAFIPARYSAAFLSQYGIDPGSLAERIVPFFSYMALHNDYTHLTINCLWLLAFGPVVARRFGTALFLIFFLVGGLAAAGLHMAFNWASLDPVIGASGAISGLMAAAIRLLPTQEAAWAAPGTARDAALLPLLSRQVLLFTAVWAAINAVAGLTGFGLGSEGQIAWQAHMGGFAAGLLLCGLFDRLRPQTVGAQL